MGVKLKRIGRREGLSEVVKQEIERVIVEHRLVPGSRLPTEKELSELLNVGRSSIREGIRALAERGIVEIIQGKGCFVRNEPQRGIKAQLQFLVNFQDKPLEALNELRLLLEVGLASLAAVRARESDLEAMSAILDKMSKARSNAEHVRLGAEFHLSIVRAAQNSFATTLFEAISLLINELYGKVQRSTDQRRQSLIDHEHIYQAIAARNPELAAENVRAHLANLPLDPGIGKVVNYWGNAGSSEKGGDPPGKPS